MTLDTLTVREHRVPGLPMGRPVALGRCRPRGAICSSRRHVLWLGNGRLAVAGLDLVAAAGSSPRPRPAGVAIVDTQTWGARRLDPRASGARLAGRRLLTFGDGNPDPPRPHMGEVRAYAVGDGRVLWRRVHHQVWDVQLAGGRAYARGLRRMFVLDPATGHVLAQPRFSLRQTLDLLT